MRSHTLMRPWMTHAAAIVAVCISAIVLCGSPGAAGANAAPTAVWQTLPPTPALPNATVGEHAEINGARIWYAQWNPGAAGIPVLLLHGGFANSNYYGHLIPRLVEHGYRVIAMDSRGHGRSTRSSAPLSYDLMADDVIALLDRLKIRQIYLVGWSDGGIIGIDLALNHPDRLAGVFAFGTNGDVSGLRDGIEKTPVFGAYLKRVPEEYRELSPTPDQWEVFSAAVTKMWETLPAFTAAQLGSIKVHTTIADGQYEEAIKPAHTQYLASTIPGARLVILPNVSHFAMLQDPGEFNGTVIAFLEGR